MESLRSIDPRVVWLSFGEADRALVGGKGASLNRLFALGAPVPPAFALTTHAYRTFAAAHGLPRHASDVADRDLAGLRARIEALPLPADLRDTVCREFAVCKDGTEAVAVRSSATAEDSAEFSFAGLHDTIL